MIYDALQYGKQVADTAANHRKSDKSFRKRTSEEYLSGFYKEDVYGIAEKEEKEKMEELLLNFMKEDDFHIQERMEEEPIKVERQMDKFKMRG